MAHDPAQQDGQDHEEKVGDEGSESDDLVRMMSPDQVEKRPKDHGQPSGKEPGRGQVQVSRHQNHTDACVQQAEGKHEPGKYAVECLQGRGLSYSQPCSLCNKVGKLFGFQLAAVFH